MAGILLPLLPLLISVLKHPPSKRLHHQLVRAICEGDTEDAVATDGEHRSQSTTHMQIFECEFVFRLENAPYVEERYQ